MKLVYLCLVMGLVVGCGKDNGGVPFEEINAFESSTWGNLTIDATHGLLTFSDIEREDVVRDCVLEYQIVGGSASRGQVKLTLDGNSDSFVCAPLVGKVAFRASKYPTLGTKTLQIGNKAFTKNI